MPTQAQITRIGSIQEQLGRLSEAYERSRIDRAEMLDEMKATRLDVQALRQDVSPVLDLAKDWSTMKRKAVYIVIAMAAAWVLGLSGAITAAAHAAASLVGVK